MAYVSSCNSSSQTWTATFHGVAPHAESKKHVVDIDAEALQLAELMEYIKHPQKLRGAPPEIRRKVDNLRMILSDMSDMRETAEHGTMMVQSHFNFQARHIHSTLSPRQDAAKVLLYATSNTQAIIGGKFIMKLSELIAASCGAVGFQYAFFAHIAENHFFASVLDLTAKPWVLGYYSSVKDESYERRHQKLYDELRQYITKVGIQCKLSYDDL